MSEKQDFAPWAATADETVSHYQSNISTGLTQSQCQINAKYRGNVGPWPPRPRIRQMLLSYFMGRILLLGATVLSLFVSCLPLGIGPEVRDLGAEPLLILLVAAMECSLLVWSARPAPVNAGCLRDGRMEVIDAASLVWGDIIELRLGDIVPADCRIARITSPVMVDGVAKDEAPVSLEARPDEKTCVCFAGSSVSRGGFFGVVCGVGPPCETVAGRTGATSPLYCFASALSIIFGIVTIIGVVAIAAPRGRLRDLRLMLLLVVVMPDPAPALAAVTESVAMLARTTVICTNRLTVEAFSVVAGSVVQSYDICKPIPNDDSHRACPVCLANIAALCGGPELEIVGTGDDAKSAVHGPAEEVLTRCDRYLDDETGVATALSGAIRNRIRGSISPVSWLGLALVDGGNLVWAGAAALPDLPGARIVICTRDELDDDEACTSAEWDLMTDIQRSETARHTPGLALADPSHVRKFVDVLATQGEVVAIGPHKVAAAAIRRARTHCGVAAESIGRIAATWVAAMFVCLWWPGALQPSRLLLARLIVAAMPMPSDPEDFDWRRSVAAGCCTGLAVALQVKDASMLSVILVAGMLAPLPSRSSARLATWELVRAIGLPLVCEVVTEIQALVGMFYCESIIRKDWPIVIWPTLLAVAVQVLFRKHVWQALTGARRK
jgi:hypothetical protein